MEPPRLARQSVLNFSAYPVLPFDGLLCARNGCDHAAYLYSNGAYGNASDAVRRPGCWEFRRCQVQRLGVCKEVCVNVYAYANGDPINEPDSTGMIGENDLLYVLLESIPDVAGLAARASPVPGAAGSVQSILR